MKNENKEKNRKQQTESKKMKDDQARKMIKKEKVKRNMAINLERDNDRVDKDRSIDIRMISMNRKHVHYLLWLKNVYLAIFLFLIFSWQQAMAISFQAGAFYGQRQIVEVEIKNVYGQGSIYFPYLAFVFKGLIIGAGYEGGYSKNGLIGLFKEKTNLKITGYEIFTGYEFKLKVLSPYLRVGYGYYAYKQTIESEYLSDFKVDEKKGAPLAAVGLKIFPLKNIFLAAEIKYVPLKVKPLDRQVDLSGFRYLAGAGFSF